MPGAAPPGMALFCPGSSAACPPNSVLPFSTPCDIDGLNCTTDACNGNGQCITQIDDCECMVDE